MAHSEFDSVGHLLKAQVERTPDKEFLFEESGERVFTYRDFDETVNRASGLLVSLGITRGDRVSLYLTNSVEYLVFYFACFKIGAWAGPVNAMLKPAELEFIINDSESAAVITQPDLYPTLAASLDKLPCVRHVLAGAGGRGPGVRAETGVGGNRVFDCGAFLVEATDLMQSTTAKESPTPDPRPLAPADEAVIIYTSGTTGKPKGVLLTHGNLLSNAQQIAEWLRLTEDDRSLLIMPLFHVNALMTTCLAALWAGGSVVLAPRFSASRHWETVARYGVSYFGSVATMLSLLNNTYPEGVSEGLDVSRLRFALCGSAPVPVEVMKRFESLFNCPVVEGYGLSESTCRSTFNPPDERRRPGSIGLPIGNEVKILDEKDRELPPGRIGEIALRGPNIMKGYYKNEAATREAFRSGWFHTGDLGYQDEEGFFYIVDRKSDMIIRGGENIYPREIDEVLYKHPAVKDAATVGVADPLYGEKVKSFIVLREGERVREEEIIAFCREWLADYKCPAEIEFLDDIPKGPTGKLLKRELASREHGD